MCSRSKYVLKFVFRISDQAIVPAVISSDNMTSQYNDTKTKKEWKIEELGSLIFKACFISICS